MMLNDELDPGNWKRIIIIEAMPCTFTDGGGRSDDE